MGSKIAIFLLSGAVIGLAVCLHNANKKIDALTAKSKPVEAAVNTLKKAVTDIEEHTKDNLTQDKPQVL